MRLSNLKQVRDALAFWSASKPYDVDAEARTLLLTIVDHAERTIQRRVHEGRQPMIFRSHFHDRARQARADKPQKVFA